MTKDSNHKKTSLIFGTNATRSEKTVGWLATAIIPLCLVGLIVTGSVQWNLLQIGIIFLLAVDVSGGVVCNALDSCKRFYHSVPKQTESRLFQLAKNKLIFTAMHIHPLIVVFCFPEIPWYQGVIWYLLLVGAATIVLLVKPILKRPVAMGLVMLALLINLYLLPSANGIEWLMPLLFLKIIGGHLVPEQVSVSENNSRNK